MTELLELRGVVEASPDAVAEILLDVRPGGRSPLAATGEAEPADSDEFTVTKEGSKLTVVVDRAARSVSQQGEWWYRGVTSVEPDPARIRARAPDLQHRARPQVGGPVRVAGPVERG